jgi:hypothetical protein
VTTAWPQWAAGVKVLCHVRLQYSDEMFEEDLLADARPQLCKFPHVAGSKISKDLFEHFTLPNGKTAYFYFRGRRHGHLLLEDRNTFPPEPPGSLAELIRKALPARPDAPSLLPAAWPSVERPEPPRPPRPDRNHLGGDDIGVVPTNEPMTLRVAATRSTAVAREDTYDEPAVGRTKPWSVYTDSAVWRPRLRQSNPRDVYHNTKFYHACFERDWMNIKNKSRFVNVIKRACGADRLADELGAIKETLMLNYKMLMQVV